MVTWNRRLTSSWPYSTLALTSPSSAIFWKSASFLSFFAVLSTLDGSSISIAKEAGSGFWPSSALMVASALPDILLVYSASASSLSL